jgi:ABC-2 type transport system permease protein
LTRIGRIFWHEYWGHLTRRSYLIFTFGFPIFMLVAPLVGGGMLALAISSALPQTDPRPVGIVDQVALLAPADYLPAGPVEVIFFADPAAAHQALAQGQLQAIYELPVDYWETGQVIISYDTAPTGEIDGMIGGWIQRQLRQLAPPALLTRLERGAMITHQGLSGTQTFSLDNIIELALVFVPLYFARLGSSFMAEYMFGSIASEVHDRTMEILITSVSPLQLVTGKLLGLLAVGLTQLGTWAGAIFILAAGVDYLFDLGMLRRLLTWDHLGLMVTVLLAAYIMDQVLAATLALFRVSSGSGSMLFNTINWVVGLGLIYAIYFVPRTPHAPLAVAASIFPITASIVLMIRVVVTEVPLWQIILAQLSLWGTIGASIFWLRWLLQRNLVASGTSFNWRAWLKGYFSRRKKLTWPTE